MEKLKLLIKRTLLKLSGQVRHLRKSVHCKAEWYGGKHTGFYVQPDLLSKDSIAYSFGIGEDISFDRYIISKHNARVFAFDPTPKSLKWLKTQELPSNFKYYDYGISDISGSVEFYLPKNPEFVSGSVLLQKNINQKRKITVQMKTFKNIIHDLGHTHIDLLKMDIEGSEYRVIEDILVTEIKISQILIEFHDRFFEDGVSKSKKVVQQLKNHGYHIFAVSDTLEEVSFIHNSVLAMLK